MGADSIRTLLHDINIPQLAEQLRNEMKENSSSMTGGYAAITAQYQIKELQKERKELAGDIEQRAEQAGAEARAGAKGGEKGGLHTELLPQEDNLAGLPDEAVSQRFEDLSWDNYAIFWPGSWSRSAETLMDRDQTKQNVSSNHKNVMRQQPPLRRKRTGVAPAPSFLACSRTMD